MGKSFTYIIELDFYLKVRRPHNFWMKFENFVRSEGTQLGYYLANCTIEFLFKCLNMEHYQVYFDTSIELSITNSNQHILKEENMKWISA